MSAYVTTLTIDGAIVAIVSIIIFALYLVLNSRKDLISKMANAEGYDSEGQFVRDYVAGKPRELGLSIFVNDDAKSLGMRYIVTSLFFFFIAGAFGLTMRLSLTSPNPSLLTPDEYNVLLTEHATLMIYMWAVGSALGFGYYLLPSHLKVFRDIRGVFSSIGYWLWLLGGALILVSHSSVRWYFYPPLSLQLNQNGGGLYAWLSVLGIEILFVGLIITSITILFIILFDRSPEVKRNQFTLFTWSIIFTIIMILVSSPPIMVGFALLFYDYFNPIFFTAASHSVLLFTILFWFWGHPIVYIAIIPYFGLIYEIIPKFTGKQIFSYKSGVIGLGLLLILSELVWGHHLFNSGLGFAWVLFFSTTSFLVVIPSAITIFNYIASLWSAERIRITTPMLFVINGIIDFIIGGVVGVMQSAFPVNADVHGTYVITGHFHFIFLGITTGISFAAFYMLFPTLSGGRKYDVKLARLHFYFTAAGSMLMSSAWLLGGFLGMPRATAGYFPFFQPYQLASIAGGFIIGIGQIFFLWNMGKSWLKAPSVDNQNCLEQVNVISTEMTGGAQ
ncbi:MAG: cbb3-type cytochrome c oxidase subunit I [Candidatus Thermoplasmatota archaeon]|nr:cbb3-type cytochrome c oxidase subunit I [Candidatus Thermoplasmatota archaeon]MCL5731412.1 cbb3-type cytochrome c oxidase subunit I [Candidatus Thermoplasmatota archaeon]